MNISTNYCLNYPKFNYLAEAIDKAMTRYEKKVYIPQIEHRENTRCRKILSLIDPNKEKYYTEEGKKDKKVKFNVKKKRCSCYEKRNEEKNSDQNASFLCSEEEFQIKGIRYKKGKK